MSFPDPRRLFIRNRDPIPVTQRPWFWEFFLIDRRFYKMLARAPSTTITVKQLERRLYKTTLAWSVIHPGTENYRNPQYNRHWKDLYTRTEWGTIKLHDTLRYRIARAEVHTVTYDDADPIYQESFPEGLARGTAQQIEQRDRLLAAASASDNDTPTPEETTELVSANDPLETYVVYDEETLDLGAPEATYQDPEDPSGYDRFRDAIEQSLPLSEKRAARAREEVRQALLDAQFRRQRKPRRPR